MRLISIAIGQSLRDRREIIVTDLDHEANIAVWLALEREGAKIVWWHFRDDGRLHPEDLDQLLSPRTRIVACTLASNAIGSILDIAEVSGGPTPPELRCLWMPCTMALTGLLTFRHLIVIIWSVQAIKSFLRIWDFSGDGWKPSTPCLLSAKILCLTQRPPSWRLAHIYMRMLRAWMQLCATWKHLGKQMNPAANSRRAALVASTEAIRSYEAQLSCAMLDALAQANATVYGITEREQISHRTPTLCFNLPGISPAEVTEKLAERNIGVRDGHMYSPRLMKRLGLTKESGAVRASLVHYNTLKEVQRFGSALAEITRA